MIIRGVNADYPDAAVALVRDGELVRAAEEEHFNRSKHASGFQTLALETSTALKSLLKTQKTMP